MREPSKERGCEGKTKLRERRYEAHADHLAEYYGKRYGVYKCPHCIYYHITTKLKKQGEYAPLIYITGDNMEEKSKERRVWEKILTDEGWTPPAKEEKIKVAYFHCPCCKKPVPIIDKTPSGCCTICECKGDEKGDVI